MSHELQWAIIAFIVLAVGFLSLRQGRANPEGTGTLGKTVSGLNGDVKTLNERLTHMEAEMDDLKAIAATTKDIARLEEKMATVRAEMHGHRELSERTNHSVDRIERLLIEKGLGK